MARHYWIALFVLLLSCFFEVSSRPSTNESTIGEHKTIEATSRKPSQIKVVSKVIAINPDENVSSINNKENPSINMTHNQSSSSQKSNEIVKEKLTENITSLPDNSSSDDDVKESSKTGHRSLSYIDNNIHQENTKEILDKIKLINNKLNKKPTRQQTNHKSPSHTGGGYIMDQETLEKLQQIIVSGKLHPYSANKIQQDTNTLINEEIKERYFNSRALPFGQLQQGLLGAQGPINYTPFPYLMNVPVLVMPSIVDSNGIPPNNDAISIGPNESYQTKQSPPSLPFNLQWPLAPFFPILIKDPLLGFMHGGGWNNFIEYGQSADVCNRRQKSVGPVNNDDDLIQNDNDEEIRNPITSIRDHFTREGRAMKKRNILSSANSQEIESKKSKKIFSLTKPSTTKKPTKQTYNEEQNQDTKSTVDSNEGDLRFPFGDFGWFGNKKPVAPSPGFFINRLKVRRGGVAIAGPGGVATAGRGGTAIVGPGGLAYTQPGGLAVAGPAARVVALSSDADLSSVVSRLQEQTTNDGSVSRFLEAIPEGKVVATGPVVYYHPKEQ